MMHFKMGFMSYNKMKAHMSFQDVVHCSLFGRGFINLYYFLTFSPKKKDNFLIFPNSSEKIKPNCKEESKNMNCLKYCEGQI